MDDVSILNINLVVSVRETKFESVIKQIQHRGGNFPLMVYVMESSVSDTLNVVEIQTYMTYNTLCKDVFFFFDKLLLLVPTPW